MTTPTRFRAETKYTESTDKKANANLPIMATVGDHLTGAAAVTGRAGWYHIRLGGETVANPNPTVASRLTQCKSEGVALVLNDYIYVIKARDRNLTYYEFHSFIQTAGGLPAPPVCPKWEQVFTVSVNSCQYRLVSGAIAAIAALAALPAPIVPTAASPWLIQVMAGDYTETANVTILQYVHVKGRGESTVLDMVANTLFLDSDTSLESLVVKSSDPVAGIGVIAEDNVVFRDVRCIQTAAAGTPDCFYLNANHHVYLYNCIAEVAENGTGYHVVNDDAIMYLCTAFSDAYSATTYGFQVSGVASVELYYCVADDSTNFGDGLHLDAVGLTCTTRWCTFAAADDDVNTGAASTWQHFLCQFDPDNSTIGGTETPLVTGQANFDDVVTFENGVTMDGLTTQNIITVPDNIAQAMNLVDVGGLEYMRVVSTNANPYLLLFPAGGGKLGLGTLDVPHGGVGSAIFAIDGPDSSADGPHIQVTTDADNYPLFQLFAWAHDNVQWVFDAYFQGAAWLSSDAGSNFRWIKINDKIYHEYDSGVAQGGAIGWNTGWSMDLTDGALTLGGPSMTVPATWNLVVADNVADAVSIDDAGGLEHMRVVSTDANSSVVFYPSGGGNVGVGVAPTDHQHLVVQDLTVVPTLTYSGIYAYHVVTDASGATEADDMYGAQIFMNMNDAGETIGNLYGIRVRGYLVDGIIGDGEEDLFGMWSESRMDGGTVNNAVWGNLLYADINAGTIAGSITGGRITVDIEAAVTSIGGNVYGQYILVDADTNPVGLVYMLYTNALTGVDYNIYQTGTNAPNLFDGNLLPSGNKTLDLGAAGARWNTLFQGTSTAAGTSRLVEANKSCPVCQTAMVRGTGSLCVVGRNSDYLLAHCPNCGNVAMEEVKHLPDEKLAERKPAPKIEFVGIHVFAMSGASRQIRVDFRYTDDKTTIEHGPNGDSYEQIEKCGLINSTYLGEAEVAVFLAMSAEQRRAFLLQLGQREWEALEEIRLIKDEVRATQGTFDAAVEKFVGKDLLKEVALPN